MSLIKIYCVDLGLTIGLFIAIFYMEFRFLVLFIHSRVLRKYDRPLLSYCIVHFWILLTPCAIGYDTVYLRALKS